MCAGFSRAVKSILICAMVCAGYLSSLPAPALCTAAYDSLEVGASYSANTNQNEFHEFWEPGEGAEIFLATPYHAGRLRFGLRYLLNTSESSDIPDFQSLFVYAGWSAGLSLPGGLLLDPGLGLGVATFFFEDEINAGLKNETETAGEIFLAVGFPLRDGWRLNATVSSQMIFTNKRIRLSYVSAGISRQFLTPGWVRRILE